MKIFLVLADDSEVGVITVGAFYDRKDALKSFEETYNKHIDELDNLYIFEYLRSHSTKTDTVWFFKDDYGYYQRIWVSEVDVQ